MLFNEAARTYQATGKYTQFKVDSIPHRQFRRRECDRRRNGFSAPRWQNPDGSIEDVWITGGHYNLANTKTHSAQSLRQDSTFQTAVPIEQFWWQEKIIL